MLIGHLSLKKNKCLYSSVEKVDFLKMSKSKNHFNRFFFFAQRQETEYHFVPDSLPI